MTWRRADGPDAFGRGWGRSRVENRRVGHRAPDGSRHETPCQGCVFDGDESVRLQGVQDWVVIGSPVAGPVSVGTPTGESRYWGHPQSQERTWVEVS